MTIRRLFLFPLPLVLAFATACSGAPRGATIPLQDRPSGSERLVVESARLGPDGSIPTPHAFDQLGCTGENVALPIRWSGVPAEAQSFTVIVHDPDAPTGVGFFHWVVTDLPADARAIGDAPLPETAREHHNDYGTTGYGGPCPPSGDAPHRYVISVYALDTPSLGLPEGATGALTRFVLANHTLAYGRLVGTYGR